MLSFGRARSKGSVHEKVVEVKDAVAASLISFRPSTLFNVPLLQFTGPGIRLSPAWPFLRSALCCRLCSSFVLVHRTVGALYYSAFSGDASVEPDAPLGSGRRPCAFFSPYAGFAIRRLTGEAVATTSCKSKPAIESSARYSASVRSRPPSATNICRSVHLPKSNVAPSGMKAEIPVVTSRAPRLKWRLHRALRNLRILFMAYACANLVSGNALL